MNASPFHRTSRRAGGVIRVLAVLLALSACGERKELDSADRNSTSAPITDSLQGPGEREGNWSGADQRSTWRALLDGSRIKQIDEVSLFTDNARAMRQFAFAADGWLMSAREERVQVVLGSSATPDTINTVIELEWMIDSLTRSAKRVNGTDKLLQPFEVDNIRQHADELVRTARAGSSSRPPGK